MTPHKSGLAAQFCGSQPRLFRWSLARILDWTEKPNLNCPVFHIHGQRDRVLPVRYTNPNVAIPAGGHVISLTHGGEVNRFLAEVLRRF